jgi:hypothetical protein
MLLWLDDKIVTGESGTYPRAMRVVRKTYTRASKQNGVIGSGKTS